MSFDRHTFFDCSLDHAFCVASDESIVCFQEIPWISDGDPATLRFEYAICPVFDIDMDEVSDLHFSSFRERDITKHREDGTIELMYSYICEISERYICRFFDDSCGFSVTVTGENPEILRLIDCLHESCISLDPRQLQYITRVIEVIS